MSRRVPLAWRLLTHDRRRVVLTVGGVAVALLLVLVLSGVVTGAMRQVTAYVRTTPADVLVSQAGTRTMHMSTSALPSSTVARARGVPGVAWAQPIGFTTGVVGSAAGRQLSYVIGYDPADGRAGPQSRLDGQPPRPGEVLLDEVAADDLGLTVGDEVTVLGKPFTVSGLFSGGTSITNTTAFVGRADYARFGRAPMSYLLVGARAGVDPGLLTDRLAQALPGTTAQTRDEFVAEESAIVSDMSADVMQIMSLLAYVMALVVVALSLYALTQANLRGYGVLKALGAHGPDLVRTLLAQAAIVVVAALVVALLLAALVAATVGWLSPSLAVTVTPRTVAGLAAASLVVAVLGSLLPLPRLLSLDPATAFRRTA